MNDLLSINISQPKTVTVNGDTYTTGIYKEPVNGPVALGSLNILGDGQADLKSHGGPYKAVYVYSYDHYDYWAAHLGRDDFAYGQFGENFTVGGMTEDAVFIGDTFEVGTALVQVTQPRVPCFKLVNKLNAGRTFQREFLQSHKVGFYLRVLREGTVQAGDALTKVASDPVQISVRDINHLLYIDGKNAALAADALKIEALSPGWVGSMQSIVARGGSR